MTDGRKIILRTNTRNGAHNTDRNGPANPLRGVSRAKFKMRQDSRWSVASECDLEATSMVVAEVVAEVGLVVVAPQQLL